MKKLLLAALVWASLLFAGCTVLNIPLEVRKVVKYNNGNCALGLRSTDDDVIWTQSSPDLCQYRVGDVLK